jgi:hypothetical protein
MSNEYTTMFFVCADDADRRGESRKDLPSGHMSIQKAWATPLTVAVTAGQPVVGLQFALKRGAILQVRLNDPGQLLLAASPTTKTVPHVLLGVQTPNDTDNCGGFFCWPQAQNPTVPLGNTPVHFFGQEWWAGSLNIGSGVLVQTDTLQRYSDHPRHINTQTSGQIAPILP